MDEYLNFSQCLRTEIIHHKEKRAKFVLNKLAFITSLFGIGFVKINEFNLYSIFYVIPYVAISYDAFICAEDYKVKRVGAFLRTHMKSACNYDRSWEDFAKRHREKWAAYTSIVLTVLVLVSSAAIAKIFSPIPRNYFTMWIIINLCLIFLVFQHYHKITSEVDAPDEEKSSTHAE